MSDDDKKMIPPGVTDSSDDTLATKRTPILDPDKLAEARQSHADLMEKTGTKKVEIKEAPPRPRPERRTPVGYWALWIIAVGSLLLNAYTLRQLLALRQFAGSALTESIGIIEKLQQQTVSYTFHVAQSVVVETDIPIDHSVDIPIKKDVEVSTTAVATIAELPYIGAVTATVPVSATVPIDEVFTIQFQDSFHVRTPVAVEFDVPVAIAVGDTELYSTLEYMKERLLYLSSLLSAPVIPGTTVEINGTAQPTEGGGE